MHGVVAAAVKMKVDTTKCKDAKSMGQAYLQDPKKNCSLIWVWKIAPMDHEG